MEWFQNHIELLLSISGISLISLLSWVIAYFTKLRKIIKTADSRLELAARIIERDENVLRSLTELSNRYDQLFHSGVYFPDTRKFIFQYGVYWYVGVDSIHDSKSPLCPVCLVKEKLPIPLMPQLRGVWRCSNCKFEIVASEELREKIYGLT